MIIMENKLRIFLKLEMKILAEYRTRQKELLLGFLQTQQDRPLSVEEIFDGISCTPDAPGKSTVYRLINRLCEEGEVKRFEEGKRFFYQLAGGEDCHHHLHLKCTGCGRLLHMDHAQSEKLIEAIYGEQGFTVSETETTLFGECGACRRKHTSGGPGGKGESL